MESKEYQTKTILQKRQNPPSQSAQVIGLDIGYSAVKGFCADSVFSFPAFAKKIPAGTSSLAAPKKTDICYQNLNSAFGTVGDVWNVGESAYAFADGNDNELATFGRQRYFSDMFHVLLETGIALGLKDHSNFPLFIQTGLPPEYRVIDSDDLIESLIGKHDFALKIGDSEFKEYHFVLNRENIGKPMDQPMGTLYSVATAPTGKPAKDASHFFDSNVLICDAGFGTFDVFNIAKGNIITKPETLNNLGMREVFSRTVNQIAREYKKDITVNQLQEILPTGKINVSNKKIINGRPFYSSAQEDISPLLEKNSKEVCFEAISHLMNVYNGLVDHDILVLTGGTCQAWNMEIRKNLSHMRTLHIITASCDGLSAVFANARGYYMYALNAVAHK